MKRKVRFHVYVMEYPPDGDLSHCFAKGDIYPEGNVVIKWRKDIGDCEEQHASFASVIGMVPHIRFITFGDKP